MNINNNPMTPKMLRLNYLIRYLEDMKFQAYHIDTKAQAEERKPEFDRLLAEADGLAKELAVEYPIHPDDVKDDTYKLIYGKDKPKKESREEWYKRQVAENGDIY